MKINKKKGILFWITGLSGSGKTSVGKKVYKKISKKYGKTILLNGDDLRKIFNLKKFSYNERYKIALSYSKFCENIINQKINIIFTTVSMFNKVREYNKKKIENYVEIYIATNIKDIIKNNKKKIYKIRNKKNIVGLDIKFEKPKSPTIKINNDFNTNINDLSKKLIDLIDNKLKY